MHKSKLTRRDFIKLAGATSAGLALSACGVKATEVPTPTSTSTLFPPTQTLTPTSTSIPTATPIPNTLRGYADALGIKIGAVAEGVGPHDQTRLNLIAEQFNQIIVTSIGWEVIGQRGENSYDFSIPDGFRRFASENNLTVLAMHLVYGLALSEYEFDLPDWMRHGGFSRNELIEIMKNHIRKVMGHYKGRVRAYSVVNEASEPSIFWNRRVGREYIEIAFQTARETDPDAILIYNNSGHETARLPKSDKVFNLVKSLKEKDLVDAVGFQMHMLGEPDSYIDPRKPPTKEELLEQMRRYGEIGLKVFVTELEVAINNLPGTLDEKLAKQAEIYRTVFEACLESSGICNDINVWGFNDIETGLDKKTLLFSDNQPKPAYFAVLDVLKRFYDRKN
jgi:endo-1,4-beta-xylanase